MLADYHVHTNFSVDSFYPMEDVIKDAIHKGIDEICFTDHVDYGVQVDWDNIEKAQYYKGVALTNVDYPNYVKMIKEMQDRYGDKITIKMGMEFGVQMQTIPQYEALYHRYPFDFIILSIHQVGNKEFWSQDFQQGKTQKEYNEGYYEELLNVVNHYQDYSVLGHMDLITRYDKLEVYPFQKVKSYIEAILEKVIKDDKGIELNTSSKRYKLKDTTPSKDILKLYHDMGGKIITIGSDSHTEKDLGAYLKEAKELLKFIDFREFCTYDKMQPIFHNL